jgi:diguanylate cyclase (GGDEF)-like protein
MRIEVQRIDGEPVSIRFNGQEFPCEEETGDTTVPREVLTGFRLSEIPDGITIKPVDSVEENIIHVSDDFGITRFSDGHATAFVEEMFRRKFWDGEVGLSPYVAALREVIAEQEEAEEFDFQDDGDYIFLHYEIRLLDDLDVRDTIEKVETTIASIKGRTDEVVHRRRDALLNIFDRGAFDVDLAYWLRNGTRNLALLMADIDHFKPINDKFGHQLGDEVLREIARTLSARCGNVGAVYRYGGEELAIVLRGADAASASHVAESIRSAVETLRFPNAPDLNTTISIGVAVAPNNGGTPEEVIKKADDALYTAKQEGRNRFRTAT